MVSATHQCESAIGTPMSPPPWTLSPPRLTSLGWQSTSFGFPVSYSKFPLSIYFTYGNVYVSMLLSPIIPLSPSPLCPKALELTLLSIIHFFCWDRIAGWLILKHAIFVDTNISFLSYAYSCKHISFFEIQIPIWNWPWEVTREHQGELLLLRQHYLLNCIALINQRSSSD